MAGLEIGLDGVEHLLLIGLGGERGHGLHLQRVRGLLEGDTLARCATTHAVGSGVDHFGAWELRQHIEHRASENVATSDRAVFEDAVI